MELNVSNDTHAKLKGFFVCNRCRNNCANGCDEIGPFGPDNCVGAYYPRKQRVTCLGKYCDDPCEYQEESDLTMEQLVVLVKYLTVEINKHLIKEVK